MITASKRMLRKESEVKSGTNEVYSDRKNSVAVTFRYETIVVGDAFCGKSTYLTLLAENEINSNSPVMLSQDRCEYEFWVEFKNKKAVFMVKDTASNRYFLPKFHIKQNVHFECLWPNFFDRSIITFIAKILRYF
jgi:hypothetical protein